MNPTIIPTNAPIIAPDIGWTPGKNENWLTVGARAVPRDAITK